MNQSVEKTIEHAMILLFFIISILFQVYFKMTNKYEIKQLNYEQVTLNYYSYWILNEVN